jgi:flagellar assembly protein FliH
LPNTPHQQAGNGSPAAPTCDSILATEREADAITLTAQEMAQQIQQEAYRDGYAKGHADALNDLRGQTDSLETLLREAHRRVTAAQHVVASHLKNELIDVVIAVATSLVRSELDARPETIISIVRAALDTVENRKVLAVRVHPGDYHMLAEQRRALPGLESARLVSDPAIPSGRCLIEVENGLIDARLESQLQEAARLLGRDHEFDQSGERQTVYTKEVVS